MLEVTELQEEVKLLLNGLNEIAQTVLHDADTKDLELIQSLPHLHLSSIMATPTRYYDCHLKCPRYALYLFLFNFIRSFFQITV